ncbi:hypothetical protein PV08_05272 [Exophiala spinifera]|uniref:Uncharacterized protein n=1 Tax=Exophiala spinifera TaxID=91928 RepID=A0A0D1ZQY9_9EURO|nr:uncharacterized protein PV08_05272 [Exophiala spinifera]KIW15227.1 hypothetical protein PV08_05272 [Exophiala spinifera]
MAPIATYKNIRNISRRVSESKGQINRETIEYMEEHLPGHFRQIFEKDPDLTTRVKAALGRNPRLMAKKDMDDALKAEKQLESAHQLPIPSGDSVESTTKSASRSTRKPTKERPSGSKQSATVPNSEAVDVDVEVDEEIEGESESESQPKAKRQRVQIVDVPIPSNINANLQELIREQPDLETFQPQWPSKSEVAIGEWGPDPNPKRLITAEIQKTAVVGFYIRNLLKNGKAIITDESYSAKADRVFSGDRDTTLTTPQIMRNIEWLEKAKEFGADQSEENLMKYVFANVGDKTVCLPWSDADDVKKNPEFGVLYAFLSAKHSDDEAESIFGPGWATPAALLARLTELQNRLKVASDKAQISVEACVGLMKGDEPMETKIGFLRMVFKGLIGDACDPLELAFRMRTLDLEEPAGIGKSTWQTLCDETLLDLD